MSAVTPALVPTPDTYSLLTDLYQITMAACYAGEGLDQRRASFELFVRRLPPGCGYLIAMGLQQALDYLESFHFSQEQVRSLQATGIFDHAPAQFWELLQDGRFTGDVWAVAEGTALFAHEPFLRIEAPLWQAQIVETYLLNTINYQTLVATRAAQIRDVAGENATILEFGSRRAFSPQASLWAARAALAAGFDGTSNVLAALSLGHQPKGTMAHSLVMALSAVNGTEDEAFAAFHRYFPGAALLIDTYDVEAAAQRLADHVAAGKMQVDAVRLDSGDLVKLSKIVRSLLPHATIFASGDLDGPEIARLQQEGAMLDGYGIGTKLVTGNPVNGVYKLVDIDGIPTMKASTGKITYPGCKQIFRQFDSQGIVKGDRLGLMNDEPTSTADYQAADYNEIPLLERVMKQGERLMAAESLEAIAHRSRTAVTHLPPTSRQMNHPTPLEAAPSISLKILTENTAKRIQHAYTQS
ncbi:MAG: nicotinate phosphoribosyltransferase [Cyanothece sp. SIO2G6]|nr:nicotinate phosphoribosyltransferase [Cyanothece sp. SIO2G6]